MSDVDEVAKSAATRWEAVGESATVVKWTELENTFGITESGTHTIREAVVVRSAKCVECVLVDAPDWELVKRDVVAIAAGGWAVTVLTHLSALGSAHQELRGSAATLQGWWKMANSELGFSQMETP